VCHPFFLGDVHVAGENPQSTTVTSSTSTSFDSDMTETVSNSVNTEEVSDADFMDALHRGTIIAVTPMGVAFSAHLGYLPSDLSRLHIELLIAAKRKRGNPDYLKRE